jgi:hypothetical protein
VTQSRGIAGLFLQPLTQKFAFLSVNDSRELAWFMQNIIIDILRMCHAYDGFGVNTLILQTQKRFSSISVPVIIINLSTKLFFSRSMWALRNKNWKWNGIEEIKTAKCLKTTFFAYDLLVF